MQKLIYGFMLFLAGCSFSAFSQEAAPQPETESAAETENSEEEKPESLQQQELSYLMQQSIAFEREKRQLANELALEKLRAELKKLRGEGDTTAPLPETPREETPAAPDVREPRILMISRVGGLTRFIVSDGARNYIAAQNQPLTINGKTYRVLTGKNGSLSIQAVLP